MGVEDILGVVSLHLYKRCRSTSLSISGAKVDAENFVAYFVRYRDAGVVVHPLRRAVGDENPAFSSSSATRISRRLVRDTLRKRSLRTFDGFVPWAL